MLSKGHFYNRTLRKIVVAFGTVFNNITMIRYDKDMTKEYERIKVPLSYGPKEKYITRLASDPDLTRSMSVHLPRISFEMTSITYDSTRKTNSLFKNYSFDSSKSQVRAQAAPIPYNFDFSLSIYVRNIEDGTQILEQILPFFTPDYTVTVNLVPEMGLKYDLPIILDSVNTTTDYEGDFLSTRMIIWDLTFTVKGYIFPQTSPTGNGFITKTTTNIYTNFDDKNSQKVYVDSANGVGVFVTGEVVRETKKGKWGKVLYFANNNTGSLVLTELTDLMDENDVIVGDYSNATYTIDTVDLNPLKDVTIKIEPNPVNANANGTYGYTETILEFPDTL